MLSPIDKSKKTYFLHPCTITSRVLTGLNKVPMIDSRQVSVLFWDAKTVQFSHSPMLERCITSSNHFLLSHFWSPTNSPHINKHMQYSCMYIWTSKETAKVINTFLKFCHVIAVEKSVYFLTNWEPASTKSKNCLNSSHPDNFVEIV